MGDRGRRNLARVVPRKMCGRKRGPIELDESGRDERNRPSENPRQESRVDSAPELTRTEKPLGLVAHDYIRACTYALNHYESMPFHAPDEFEGNVNEPRRFSTLNAI